MLVFFLGKISHPEGVGQEQTQLLEQNGKDFYQQWWRV